MEDNSQKAINNELSSKALKRIKEAGVVIQVIGWAKIVLPFIVPFIISGDYFFEATLSYSYTDFALNICLGIIFVILGSRIQKGPDKNTKKYLWIMTCISIVSIFLNYAINGTYSFSIAILGACIYAFWGLKNIQINEKQLNYKISGYKYIWVIILFPLIIFSGLVIDSISYSLDEINSSEEVSNLVTHRYTNSEYNFSILLPEGWKIGSPTRSSETIVQRAVNDSRNISIMVIDLNTSKKSVKEFGTAQDMAKEMATNAKAGDVSNVKLIDFGETTISERPAYWVSFSSYSNEAKTEYTTIVYSLIKDGYLFNISSLSTSQEFLSYLPVFQEASNSFTFRR